MGHAQGGEGALELRTGIPAIGHGIMAKKAEAIGIDDHAKRAFANHRQVRKQLSRMLLFVQHCLREEATFSLAQNYFRFFRSVSAI
jgi:hypothetical protein